jgi:hypothetical protein
MSTKFNPGEFDCYAAAKQHEEMFILLARDRSGPWTVRMWARRYWWTKIFPLYLFGEEYFGMKPLLLRRRERKYREALACAAKMQKQRGRFS